MNLRFKNAQTPPKYGLTDILILSKAEETEKTKVGFAKSANKQGLKKSIQNSAEAKQKVKERAVSSDFTKSIKKRSFSPIKESMSVLTKKSLFQHKDINKNFSIDLLSLFIRDLSKLRDQLERALNQLGIKFIVPSFTSGCIVYKCEKSEVKFDLQLDTSTPTGVLIRSNKRQGNIYSFRELVNLILKRLNEISEG